MGYSSRGRKELGMTAAITSLHKFPELLHKRIDAFE